MWFSWKEDLDEGHQRGRCARPRCAPSGFKTTIGSSLLCSTISCHLCRPGVKTQSQVIMKHNIWSKREPGVGNSLVLAASSGYKSRPSLTSLPTSFCTNGKGEPHNWEIEISAHSIVLVNSFPFTRQVPRLTSSSKWVGETDYPFTWCASSTHLTQPRVEDILYMAIWGVDSVKNGVRSGCLFLQKFVMDLFDN